MSSIFRTSCLILAAALLFGSEAVAQRKQPSMDVGTVSLSLRMPRDRVLAQIKQAGYKFLELAPEGKETVVGVTHGDLADPVQRAMVAVDNDGRLFFRNGTLVRIQKQVAAGQINTDRDLALSLYVVVQEFEKEGSGHLCGVKTTAKTPYIDSPSIEAKDIALTCNLGSGVFRAIFIHWVTMEGQGSQLHVRVFQQLSSEQ